MLRAWDIDFDGCGARFKGLIFGVDLVADLGNEIAVAGQGDVFFREGWVVRIWDADFDVSFGGTFPVFNVGVVCTCEEEEKVCGDVC